MSIKSEIRKADGWLAAIRAEVEKLRQLDEYASKPLANDWRSLNWEGA